MSVLWFALGSLVGVVVGFALFGFFSATDECEELRRKLLEEREYARQV